MLRLPAPPRSLPAVLLALLLAWSGWALGTELTTFAAALGRPHQAGGVEKWRLATRGAEGLGAFLAVVDGHLPDDRVVVFDSHLENPGQQFFLSLWAAYYLPRQRVLNRNHPRARQAGEYVILYNARLDAAQRAERGLTEVFRHTSGVLYRADR